MRIDRFYHQCRHYVFVRSNEDAHDDDTKDEKLNLINKVAINLQRKGLYIISCVID